MTSDEPAPRQTVSERVTVGLIPKAVDDLGMLTSATGLSKTDVINRAISLYAFVTRELTEGKELLVRKAGTDEIERVTLL